MSTMVRTQVYLTGQQSERLQALSQLTGRTQSDLIREGVDSIVQQLEAKRDWKTAVMGIVGIWADHDRVEDFIAEGRRLSDERLTRFGIE